MKILKTALRILISTVAIIICLAILALVVVNLAKFAIYADYYGAETALCKNPGLNDGFICQGIAAVDGQGLILVSGYMADKSASRIYVTNERDESYYVSLNCGEEIYKGHAGGISVSGDTAYIANGGKIYSFPLDSVLSAKNGDVVNIGTGTVINNKASFLYTDDEYLYVGTFTDDSTDPEDCFVFETAYGEQRAIFSVYPINDLSAPLRVYSIPDRVQGVCVTPDGTVVLSSSYGMTSSVYYFYKLEDAVETEHTLTDAPVYLFEKELFKISGPAMAEGLDLLNGEVITLTESASNKYFFGRLFFATDIVSLNLEKLMSDLAN